MCMFAIGQGTGGLTQVYSRFCPGNVRELGDSTIASRHIMLQEGRCSSDLLDI